MNNYKLKINLQVCPIYSESIVLQNHKNIHVHNYGKSQCNYSIHALTTWHMAAITDGHPAGHVHVNTA